MRQDIATRFRHATKECSEALWKKARDRPYLYNLEPQVAFHGTRAASLPSIGKGWTCTCDVLCHCL